MFQSLVDETGPPPNVSNQFQTNTNLTASIPTTQLGMYKLDVP